MKLYRPLWTCGKYNKEHKKAIVYNLIEGQAYFFEEESAIVIGEILSYGRNNPILMQGVAEKTGIHIDCITDFVVALEQLGILLDHIPNSQEIRNYRSAIAQHNKENYNNSSNLPQGISPSEYELIGAEEEYAKYIEGWSNVVFEMTYRCSEKCIHCYNIGSTHYAQDIDRRGEREELTFNDYKEVIDQLVQQGLFKVCLTGGDPFSKSIIWDVIDYLYQNEIAVEIYTNGISITNSVDKLASFYPRIVGLTIYSGDANIHDQITRTKGSYERTVSTISQLSELGIPIQLKCCVFKTNIASYKSIYELARKYCALPQIEINIRNSLDGNKYVSENLRLLDEEYEMLFKDSNIYPYITSDTLNTLIKRDFKAKTCKAGINSCTITPEGNVILCPAFHLVLGNVKENSLMEISQSNFLKEWKETTLNDFEECGRHPHCDFCSICAGENFSDTGSAYKSSENKCFMARKRYEYAKKIHKKTDKSDVRNYQTNINNLKGHEN